MTSELSQIDRLLRLDRRICRLTLTDDTLLDRIEMQAENEYHEHSVNEQEAIDLMHLLNLPDSYTFADVCAWHWFRVQDDENRARYDGHMGYFEGMAA